MLNVLVVQNCAVLETLVKALALYLTFSRSGPNTAPRAHMGSPVWAASNHFTATSPESSGKGQRKEYPYYSRWTKEWKWEVRGQSVKTHLCDDTLITKHCLYSSLLQESVTVRSETESIRSYVIGSTICKKRGFDKHEMCEDSWKGNKLLRISLFCQVFPSVGFTSHAHINPCQHY